MTIASIMCRKKEAAESLLFSWMKYLKYLKTFFVC